MTVPSKQKGRADFKRTALVGPVLFALIVVGIFYRHSIQKFLGIDEDTKNAMKIEQRQLSKKKK